VTVEGPEVEALPRLVACTIIVPSPPSGRVAGRTLVSRCHQGEAAKADEAEKAKITKTNAGRSSRARFDPARRERGMESSNI